MHKKEEVLSAATLRLETRHHISDSNTLFNGDQLSFAAYVSASREMIRQARSASSHDNPAPDIPDKIADGNSPFELEPLGNNVGGKIKKYRRGILLVHGLSDSPYFMRPLAVFFQENGFRVMAVLLPGHGTRPGDLLDTRWQEWARAVAYGADKLAAEVDEMYLGGYSAGGALSLYQSLQDQRVRGLFLFSPALEISSRAAYAHWHKLVSWLIPRLKWVEINPDNDIYKYESFAKNAATQMYKLTRTLRDRLKQHEIKIPVFTVASADDKTVNTSATLDLMLKQANPSNKIIIYTTDAAKYAKSSAIEKIEWVDSVVPEQKILSSAHTAIVIPPEDEHYGANGDYANCIHYYPDNMEKFHACIARPQECWQGELTDENLEAGTLRRLMYNPNFSRLKESLKLFIEKLP